MLSAHEIPLNSSVVQYHGPDVLWRYQLLCSPFPFLLFMVLDEVPAIVADIGSYVSRLGTGGETSPKRILRTVRFTIY